MAYLVRRSTRADLDALTGLLYEYLVDFYQRPRPPVEQVHALIEMCLVGQRGLQFVAEQEGRLVGFATLYAYHSTFALKPATVMNDLYVVEAARGSGVAAGLFQACQAYSEEQGCAFMQWETGADNVRAQRFYEKMGGRRVTNLFYEI